MAQVKTVAAEETPLDDQDPLVDEDLLAEMIRALVDHPQDVRVVPHSKNGGVELQIYVHASDRRHVIGRQGRMVMLLRQFFGVIAARQQRKTTIEVMESAEERQARRTLRADG